MTSSQVLISGIPGTGKSKYARWLVQVHGFVRCPSGEEPGADFFRELERALAHERLVIDWGFPAFDPQFGPCIAFVRSLVERGVENWWFDGDRSAALKAFLRRGTVHKAAWDRQLSGIRSHWQEISDVFDGRILRVISEGPQFSTNEEKFQQMFQDRLASGSE